MNSNIWKCYCIRGFASAWVIVPTIVLFYRANGLTFQDILALKAFSSLVIIIGEVPSGYFADVVGRKRSLSYSAFFWLVSTILYCVGVGMYWFLVAEFFLGLAVCLMSGADSALLFDSLQQLGRSRDYTKVEARMGALSGFSEALAGLLGAWVASIHLRYPFYIHFVFIFIVFILCLSLVEPARKQLPVGNSHKQGIAKAMRFAFIEDRVICQLILFIVLMANGTFLIVWLSQAYMENIGMPVAQFGFWWAVFHVVLALGSLVAPLCERSFGRYATYVLVMLLLSGGLLLLAILSNYWGMVAVGMCYMSRGLRTPVVRAHLQERVESDIRATVLSLQGLVFRLVYVLIGPFVGWLVDAWSLRMAFFMSSLFFLLSGSLFLWRVVQAERIPASQNLSE